MQEERLPLLTSQRVPARVVELLLSRHHYHGYFERILHTHPATAWVAFNDDLALIALDYLREAGVRLPRDLSLVGFDDTLEGFGEGLTSYSFNVAAIVNEMLEHVLAPGRTRPRDGSVEMAGMVVERQTSGEAPRRNG
jgi:DNA-binding LacI/PurR family transcriptional regulator